MIKKKKEPTFKEKAKSVIIRPFLFFKKICFYIGFFAITVAFIMSLLTFLYFYTLPDISKMDYEELKDMAVLHVKESLENKEKQYKWIDISEINRDYLYTIVMAEDSNYFKHSGINYDELINSVAKNIKLKEFAYGASTITQQVAKNLFLSQEKSLYRKLREYSITKELEKRFSKNEILEIYLNIAEFGYDIYGVNAASWNYFKKHPKDINAAEGALIALLLPSPKKYAYSIIQNHNISPQNRKKYERIIKDMRYHEFISPEQYRYYTNYNFFGDQ